MATCESKAHVRPSKDISVTSSLTLGTHGRHYATRPAAIDSIVISVFGRRSEGRGQPGSDPALDSSVLSFRCMNSLLALGEQD